ncbi:hypothetical protein L226DRAFT_235378 [Lentinus tigrinus ALCF2SS1-7]|uniref:RBR-type E3 ubiquitin transferase n=1 Tax=Lentinus tigrinus ALCF2SS1-6 TaxID=1328759 RepID=A0A5C2SQD0_9APHY|nr:hypothetical protein L227DRAFT_218960 [Lentinus tigrinus ALCF2SS1-6]RPD78904.1 hypothetical protein L226DRAFT_235378 [Lentinus tigrinus ALCF2SS1-7]
MSTARHSRSTGIESDLHREIARLSVNDIEQLVRTEGDGRTSRPDTDARLALRLAIEEARALEAFERDRALALRMQTGEDWPGTLPRVNTERPPPAPTRAGPTVQTPAVAARNPFIRQPVLERAQTPGRISATRPANASRAEGGWFATMWNWWFGNAAAGTFTNASPSPAPPPALSVPVNAAQHNRLTGHDCVSCMDPIRGVEVRTPCGHYYDKTCILELFEAAMKDESLFPPRCCRQRIPFASVSSYMGAASVTKLRERTLEFGTQKRVYCAKPSCSRFLGKQYEGNLPYIRVPRFQCTAPGCTTVTCSSCKNEVKSGLMHQCQASNADDHVLAMGQRSGWARCPGCETMIELNMGCYHMTCRCRTEFCYLCRALWKTCACAQWDERRLLAAAEARAEAQIRFGGPQRAPVHPPREPPAPAAPAAPIARPPVVEERLQGLRRDVLAAQPPLPRPNAASTITRTHTTRPQAPPAGASSSRAAPRPLPSSSTRPATVSQSQSTTAADPYSIVEALRAITEDTQTRLRPQAANKRDREELVQHWMERLRVDHDCNHGAWTYRRGAGKCEVCHDRLPLYLFRCNGCEMMACRRCRWNRL